MAMAAASSRAPARAAARFAQRRRRSSGGRVLGEEEKAAENVYIKYSTGANEANDAAVAGAGAPHRHVVVDDDDLLVQMEQEKLEKLAHKGPSPGEQASSTPSSAASDVKTGGGPTESTSMGVSTDKNRNYAVLAGTVAAVSAMGWYLLSKPKKSEEVVD